jgi:hypothetical protein
VDPLPIVQASASAESMTSATQEPSNDWHRLATASSVVDAVAHHVGDLIQLRAEDLPEWLTRLGVPAGWRLARFDGNGIQPSRIAVCSRQPHGGEYGCETISVFGFTGIPPVEVVHDNVDRTLRDLHADDITTQTLATPQTPGVAATRSSGYFHAAGLRVWGQYSTYLGGSDLPAQGRLIQHSVFIESGCRAMRTAGITQLTDSVHHAFLTALETS